MGKREALGWFSRNRAAHRLRSAARASAVASRHLRTTPTRFASLPSFKRREVVVTPTLLPLTIWDRSAFGGSAAFARSARPLLEGGAKALAQRVHPNTTSRSARAHADPHRRYLTELFISYGVCAM